MVANRFKSSWTHGSLFEGSNVISDIFNVRRWIKTKLGNLKDSRWKLGFRKCHLKFYFPLSKWNKFREESEILNGVNEGKVHRVFKVGVKSAAFDIECVVQYWMLISPSAPLFNLIRSVFSMHFHELSSVREDRGISSEGKKHSILSHHIVLMSLIGQHIKSFRSIFKQQYTNEWCQIDKWRREFVFSPKRWLVRKNLSPPLGNDDIEALCSHLMRRSIICCTWGSGVNTFLLSLQSKKQ